MQGTVFCRNIGYPGRLSLLYALPWFSLFTLNKYAERIQAKVFFNDHALRRNVQ
jgi:hypothetical protein